MSTQSNDTNPVITLANYEEYFLMYVDEELNPQEKAMVEAFLQFHPELQGEMNLLMGTKLEPEPLTFDFKESLLSKQLAAQNTDETLLLHIDNELDETARKGVEEKLEKDEAYRRQHALLLRTKSDPAEVVPHPNKAELYRHSVYRMRTGFALRVAAAVLLIASLGVLYLRQDDPLQDGPATATVTPSSTPVQQPGVAAGQEQPNSLATAPAPVAKEEQAVKPVPASKPHPEQQLAANLGRKQNKPKTDAPGNKDKQAPVVKDVEMDMDATLAYEEPAVSLPRNEGTRPSTLTASKKEVQSTVTSATSQPYITTEAVPEPMFASRNEDDRKGNFKSLLRKATRMVERRTGINATNEDEQLLIGVVAVKLK